MWLLLLCVCECLLVPRIFINFGSRVYLNLFLLFTPLTGWWWNGTSPIDLNAEPLSAGTRCNGDITANHRRVLAEKWKCIFNCSTSCYFSCIRTFNCLSAVALMVSAGCFHLIPCIWFNEHRKKSAINIIIIFLRAPEQSQIYHTGCAGPLRRLHFHIFWWSGLHIWPPVKTILKCERNRTKMYYLFNFNLTSGFKWCLRRGIVNHIARISIKHKYILLILRIWIRKNFHSFDDLWEWGRRSAHITGRITLRSRVALSSIRQMRTTIIAGVLSLGQHLGLAASDALPQITEPIEFANTEAESPIKLLASIFSSLSRNHTWTGRIRRITKTWTVRNMLVLYLLHCISFLLFIHFVLFL